MDDVGAAGEVCLVGGGLPAVGAVDLLDEPAGLGDREGRVLELGARELGGLPLETGVVAQDPTVGHEFSVPQGMSREPFDAQERMAGAGEVDQVHQGEDGAVGCPDDGDGDGFGARDCVVQIAGFEHDVEFEPLKGCGRCGERERQRCWGGAGTQDQAWTDDLRVGLRILFADADCPVDRLYFQSAGNVQTRSGF